MAGNGRRRPPRPRIELVSGSPSPDEAAAVIAAVERFLADTAPAPAQEPARSGWQRAALLEGANREPAVSAWGEPPGWGALRTP